MDREYRCFASSSDIFILCLGQKQHADDKGNESDDYRIPETGIDVPCCHAHTRRDEWQQPSEYAISNVAWKRHRCVTNPGREDLYQKGSEFSPVKLLPCETGSLTKIAGRDPSRAN